LSNLPTVKSKEFVKVIKKIGFVLHRQQGSHAIYKHINGLRVVVPIHAGKDLKQNTLMSMIQDVGLDKEKFYELLMK
jgi:predicted RNA binding protein YcfA (HicA-like mRNA interferase family)